MSSESRTLSIRLPVAEYRKVVADAKAQGMTVSSYVRMSLTGEIPPTPANTHALYTRLDSMESRLEGLSKAITEGQGFLGPSMEEG